MQSAEELVDLVWVTDWLSNVFHLCLCLF